MIAPLKTKAAIFDHEYRTKNSCPIQGSDYNMSLALTLILALSTSAIIIDAKLSPIVFVPGDGGSQLEARLNKTSRVHYICDYKSDWYDIWLNIHLLTPGVFDCLCDNMRLVYNKTTRLTQNSPGVEIRPANFGSLDSVDYLDILRVPKTDYFDEIIKQLIARKSYTRDLDMVGAPFDFRKAPNELSHFFKNLTTLIQDTFVLNNYRPVTIICHSMGCLNTVHLMNMHNRTWKSMFVKRIISLAAPWDGSFKAITAMLFGDNLGIPLLNSQKLQQLQSTFPSLMYLFPKEPTFARDRILVESLTKNYTLQNLDDLFEDTGMLDQKEMWHDTRAITATLKAPEVELWCLYGNGVETSSKIKYNGALEDKKYVELFGDGDGTVNLDSLKACENFQDFQDEPVFTRMFENLDHIDILRQDVAANFIVDTILSEDI